MHKYCQNYKVMLKLTLLWLIGEMVNTSPSQGDIHGFKSHMSHQEKLMFRKELFLFYIKIKHLFTHSKHKTL